MNDPEAQRIMGIAGIAVGVVTLLTIPLYFVYSGPPPAWIVFTRDLLNLFVCAALLVFVACFTHLIRRADSKYEWVGSILYGAGMLFVGVVLVATALEAGVVFGSPDGTLDPTTDGPLADANILMHGSVKRMLTAVMLLAAAYATTCIRLFPGWVAWSALLIALANLAFVPSLYFGRDVTQFYSAIGWGNSAFVGSFLAYWVLAVGIAALAQGRQ